eukprot:11499083-Ditylum_brightwellii.AAC.1
MNRASPYQGRSGLSKSMILRRIPSYFKEEKSRSKLIDEKKRRDTHNVYFVIGYINACKVLEFIS